VTTTLSQDKETPLQIYLLHEYPGILDLTVSDIPKNFGVARCLPGMILSFLPFLLSLLCLVYFFVTVHGFNDSGFSVDRKLEPFIRVTGSEVQSAEIVDACFPALAITIPVSQEALPCSTSFACQPF